MDTRGLAPPWRENNGSWIGGGLALVIALVAGAAVHFYDKNAMATAAAKRGAAEQLATQWQGAALECSNGVKQLVEKARADADKQHRREAAAIAAARRAGAREQAAALEIEQAKIPSGCGEAVQWGNQQAHDLGSW